MVIFVIMRVQSNHYNWLMLSSDNPLGAGRNNERYLSDLLKINFKDNNYLANNGKSLCTVPTECMEEILSSLHLLPIKNIQQAKIEAFSNKQQDQYHTPSKLHHQVDKDALEQQIIDDSTERAPIKVGLIFYIQFYFTGQCIYYDRHNSQLILSRHKRTAFKIIEHITKNASNSKDQAYDYIGNVMPNEHRYLIVIANELLYLKFTDHSVYLGSYDEKCVVTFTHSIFHLDRAQDMPLLCSPCRLYSVEQQKYVVFDIKNNQIVLKEESVCIQGMCMLQSAQFQVNELQSPTLPFRRKKTKIIPKTEEENNNKISLRVLQGNNRYYLLHHNYSTQKLTHDLNRMLHPIQEKLNTSNTFLMRYEPISFYKPETTFNLSNISNITMNNNFDLLDQEEEKEEIVEELTLKEVNFKSLTFRAKEDITFQFQFYPSYNNHHQIFLYDTMATKQRVRGRQVVKQKQLYLDYRQVIASNKQQCILKEYNSQRIRRQSSKYKNILRVEFIRKEALQPYVYYYSILLNLKIYNYYKAPAHSNNRSSQQRHRMRLNLNEIQDILSDYCTAIEALAETNKQKSYCLMHELLQINFISMLEELLEAIIAKKKHEEREEIYSTIRQKEDPQDDYPYQNIQSIQTIVKIVLLITKAMPSKLIDALLRTEKSMLLIRLCRFQQANRVFSEQQCICLAEPKEMLTRLEKVIRLVEQSFSRSRCKNICILWAYRLLKAHQIHSNTIDELCQKLVQGFQGKLSEDYLIVLQLIKLSRGDIFYARNVVKFLPFQRLQQEEIPFSLREAYFNRIIRNYKDNIRLPFRMKFIMSESLEVSLQKDNKRILRTYLEEVLPKNTKFENIENKLFSLQCCQLYLHFSEDLLEEIIIEDQPCKEYLPLLITLLEEHLERYHYDPQYQSKYVMQLLKCLELTLQKYVRYVAYEESELGVQNEEMIVRHCLQEYNNIIIKKQAHTNTRRSHDLQRDTTLSKNTKKTDKKSQRQQKQMGRSVRAQRYSKKKEEGKEVSRATRILNFFSLKKLSHPAEIIECIDKDTIWTQLNGDKLTKEERLDLFQRVLSLSSLLLSPASHFKEVYQGLIVNPLDFSHKFLLILELLANKAYQTDLWGLLRRLSSEQYSEDEWRIIIAIINKNRLLKFFILYHQASTNQPTEMQLASLFGVLNHILKHYLEWTKNRIGVDYFNTTRVQQNFIQIQTNYHHFSNDLEPLSFLSLLINVEATYIEEEMALHLTLIKAVGAMTTPAYYSYYCNYILRYECHNFQNTIVQLSLAFIATLTTPQRVQFANSFQYSLFKQSEPIKTIICSVAEIKEEASQNAPQRITNFNILSELNDRRVSRLTFTSEDSSRLFLINLFRLLALVESSSSTHKEILPKLTYGVIIGVVSKFSGQTLLKHEVIGFMLVSIEKQMSYGLNKYLKTGEESEAGDNEEEEREEYALFLDFVKHTNYLLQREIEAFKALNLNNEREVVFISYALKLLSLVRIRDTIGSYLNFEPNDKVYRSFSGISEQLSLVSRSAVSQQDDSSVSSSHAIKEERQMVARARHLLHHHNAVQIDESEVGNIEGINKLLCYEVLESLDVLSRSQELPAELAKPLQWVEARYKISLANHSVASQPQPQKQLLYTLDKSFLTPNSRNAHKEARNTFYENYRNTLQDNNQQSGAPQFDAVNNFLSLKVETYLVLLVEVLQRAMLQLETGVRSELKVAQLMVLIEVELSEQIKLYKLEDQEYGNRDFEVLPEQYYQRSGLGSGEEVQQEKYHQRCCQLDEKRLVDVVEMALMAHRLQKPLYLLYLHTILERLACYNVANQVALQCIFNAHFPAYYELVFAIIHSFCTLSPIIDDAFFTPKDLLNRNKMAWERIYEGSAAAEERATNCEQWVNSLRGMEGYHLASLNYYTLVRMLLASSRTLNFQFKSLFSRPTIEKESILSELIEVLDLILKNCNVLTEEKLEFVRVTLKLINTFLRGPIEPNIQVAINKDYTRILMQLLAAANRCPSDAPYFRLYSIGIKKLIAQALFILIPFIGLAEERVKACEGELREAYIRSKKAYKGNFENIIGDYVERRHDGDQALLHFELALNFYYCLIEIYAQRKASRIVEVQVELLSRKRREKRRRKEWMVFYQLYQIIAVAFYPLYRRLTTTYEDFTDGRSQEELLQRAIVFFTRHVSQVEVRVYGRIKKISFLLLREASCYNVSIRKEFYRLIGKEERELRLRKFMKVSKFIIIRLEISKLVNTVISHFKPLEIVLLNRQLWKSLCFLMALLLNVAFVFRETLTDFNQELYFSIKYALFAFTYLFVLFLFLIYFIQIFPLKLKVYRILRRRGFRLRTLLIFINDKTLGFAVFYSVFMALSFNVAGFVSLLLLDYFFRFKVSSKITFLMFRSVPKIFYVVILIFTLLYVFALLAIKQEKHTDECVDVAGCTQSLFYIYMELRFNVNLPYEQESILALLALLPRLFLKLINVSLLVGIIFMEKRKEDQRTESKVMEVRDVCFICGGQRNAIEKARNSNKGFYHHVEMEHNLWNYIYYLVYLKNKERKNLNTIEAMIIQKWDNNQIDWLPDRTL